MGWYRRCEWAARIDAMEGGQSTKKIVVCASHTGHLALEAGLTNVQNKHVHVFSTTGTCEINASCLPQPRPHTLAHGSLPPRLQSSQPWLPSSPWPSHLIQGRKRAVPLLWLPPLPRQRVLSLAWRHQQRSRPRESQREAVMMICFALVLFPRRLHHPVWLKTQATSKVILTSK